MSATVDNDIRCQYGYRHIEGVCIYCERDTLLQQAAENERLRKRVDRLVGMLTIVRDDTRKSGGISLGVWERVCKMIDREDKQP